MEIKTKFKIGDRLCFIENGAMVFDNVESITVHVYHDGSKTVYYNFKESQRMKNESDVMESERSGRSPKAA